MELYSHPVSRGVTVVEWGNGSFTAALGCKVSRKMTVFIENV
jgi:hypothetical protein